MNSKTLLAKYRRLHDGLSEIVENGNLDNLKAERPELYQWIADSLASLAGSDPGETGKVTIEVTGGVADVTHCSPGIDVQIIDHDVEEIEEEDEEDFLRRHDAI